MEPENQFVEESSIGIVGQAFKPACLSLRFGVCELSHDIIHVDMPQP